MTERDPEEERTEGTTGFRDSEIEGDDALHASFEGLDKPSPGTDPFAEKESGTAPEDPAAPEPEEPPGQDG